MEDTQYRKLKAFCAVLAALVAVLVAGFAATGAMFF